MCYATNPIAFFVLQLFFQPIKTELYSKYWLFNKAIIHFSMCELTNNCFDHDYAFARFERVVDL